MEWNFWVIYIISSKSDVVINTWSIGNEVSLLQLASRVTSLESSGSGSAALVNYTSEPNAFFGGVNPGGDYLKNFTRATVQNAWRPAYKFTNVGDALTTSTAITNMNATAWTVEAYVYPTASPDNEQYFIDFRNPASPDNAGFAIGIAKWTNLSQPYFRPVVYSSGTISQTGPGGATLRTQSGPTNFHLNCWGHIAVTKISSDPTNIYLFLNGVSCGSVAVGPNYTTSATWTQAR